MLVLDASIRAAADLHKLPIAAQFFAGEFLCWLTIPDANAGIRHECTLTKRLLQFLPDARDVVMNGLAWRLALPTGYAIAIADTDCNDQFRSEVKIDARHNGDINGEPYYEPVLLTEEVKILFRGDDTPTLPRHWLECSVADAAIGPHVEARVIGELVAVDWANGEATYRCEIE